MSAKLQKLMVTLDILKEQVWILSNKQKSKIGLEGTYFIKAIGLGWEVLDINKNCIEKLGLEEGFRL